MAETTRDRLRETCGPRDTKGAIRYDTETICEDMRSSLTHGDARKLDALVAACEDAVGLMETYESRALRLDYTDDARRLSVILKTLAAITTPEGE